MRSVSGKSIYDSYLTVSNNGEVWLPLGIARKLVAGYQPLDDGTGFTPPSADARANDIELMAAWRNAPLSLSRPETIERDDGSFVNFKEYLFWVERCNEGISLDIRPPRELWQLFLAKLANWTASIDGPFESLELALVEWFDTAFEELPELLQQRVERDFFPVPWGLLNSEQRRYRACWWDAGHDPTHAEIRQRQWDWTTEFSKNEQEIRELTLKATLTASEKAELSTLRARNVDLEEVLGGVSNGRMFDVPFPVNGVHSIKTRGPLDDWINHGAVAHGVLNPDDAEADAERKIRTGRYTFLDAARVFEEQTGERGDELRLKLLNAARDGRLPIYERGKYARYVDKINVACLYEMHWQELNAWLRENEPHVRWEFPAPADKPTESAGALSPPAEAALPIAEHDSEKGNASQEEQESSASKLSPPATIDVPVSNEVVRRNPFAGRRSNELTTVLTMAWEKAVNQQDKWSAWAALQKMATSNERPPPLIGYAEGEGVKYNSDDDDQGVAILSRKDFFRKWDYGMTGR
jgi:hypothetical protein